MFTPKLVMNHYYTLIIESQLDVQCYLSKTYQKKFMMQFA